MSTEEGSFTEEELGLMIDYCGGDPRVRRKGWDKVFEQRGSEEWPLEEFLKKLNDAVAKIPEGSRSEARVEIGGYESVTFEIFFRRPETDDEIACRVASALKYARQRLHDERRTYERLRQKYG
jgi:hypothetical protein